MLGRVIVAGLVAACFAGCVFDRSGVPAATRDSPPDSVSDVRSVDLTVGDAPRPDILPDSTRTDVPFDVASIDVASFDGPWPDGPWSADMPPSDVTSTPDALDPLTPFGTPSPLTALNSSAAEDDPTLTGDMLEIFFDRDGDIHRSTRSSVTAGWGAPQAVTALNTTSGETTPGITPDGLTIFFSSDRSGGIGSYDIWTSTRASRIAQWSTPQPVSTVNSSDSDSCPCPSADLLTLTFAVRISSDWDITQSTRASTGAAWGTPTPVAAVNSSDADVDPWRVGVVMVFASERPGLGSTDLYISTRSGGVFGAPVAVASLNTSASDTDPWLSADLRTLVFASDRNGTWDLFIATR